MRRFKFLLFLIPVVMLVFSVMWRIGPAWAAVTTPTYGARLGDPCTLNVRSVYIVNLAAAGSVATGTAGLQTYICHIGIVTATAQNIALVEGTGATCGTNTAGMAGGATAATGWNLPVNGEIMEGDGSRWLTVTATAADNVCLLPSSTGQISGVIDYVQQ